MTRIRIRSGPWPERIGCEGVIVEAPKGYDRYPFHKLPSSEVVVLLDDDPLSCEKRGCDHSPDRYLSCTLPNPDEDGEAWTCSIGREDVEVVCEHLVANWIDDRPDGPEKVWRCAACGFRFRCVGPLVNGISRKVPA